MQKKLLIMFFILLYNMYGVEFKSQENKTYLIELYSSQGCSSCPPADEWVTDLKDHKELFKKFIPMVFHVTYWDYIGWKDIFAKPKNTKRQQYYAAKFQKTSYYTPQFIIDGDEYRRWFIYRYLPSFDSKYGGVLKVNYKNGNVNIDYDNKLLINKTLIANVAILGFDYAIDIKSGENSSKILNHDFVVLEHIQENIEGNNGKYNLRMKLKEDISKNKKAIVVWFEDDNLIQYQAVGGYLTEN